MLEIHEISDVEALMRVRMEVIDCVFGHPDQHVMRALERANRLYYERHLADGSHVACLASIDGEFCGSGATCLYDEMPSPDNISGKCAYIMNVYVRATYRHRGIASHIVKWLIDRAKMLGADKIYLETTDMASSLYRSMGFHPMDNLMIYEDDKN